MVKAPLCDLFSFFSSLSKKDRSKFDFCFVILFLAQLCHSSRQDDKDKKREGTEYIRCIFSPQASISCCRQKNNVSARAGFMSKTLRGSFTAVGPGPAPGKHCGAGLNLRAQFSEHPFLCRECVEEARLWGKRRRR